jgi:glycosyltransferase involved in cell wall biosynthesis
LKCLDEIKSKIPNIRFLMIGEGHDRKKLSDFISTKNLRKYVIFAGQLDMSDCLYLIKHSTLLVLTSCSESFPNVLLEGQALGIPVVTFDVGAASEIVKHGITGFVTPMGDRSEFIRCVIHILLNRSYANEMGKEGMKRALNIFSMSRKVNNFISMAERDLSMFR